MRSSAGSQRTELALGQFAAAATASATVDRTPSSVQTVVPRGGERRRGGLAIPIVAVAVVIAAISATVMIVVDPFGLGARGKTSGRQESSGAARRAVPPDPAAASTQTTLGPNSDAAEIAPTTVSPTNVEPNAPTQAPPHTPPDAATPSLPLKAGAVTKAVGGRVFAPRTASSSRMRLKTASPVRHASPTASGRTRARQ